MKLHIFILSFLFISCKSSIDIENIEQREHGLSYIKGTNKLVEGHVVRKFENGKTAELNTYKDGKPIGEWFAYGYNGEVVSHGFGIDAKKYENKITNSDLTNSFLSINIEGSFSFATFYVDNKAIFEKPKIMLDLSRQIFTDYSTQYKINDILFYDKEHEYSISKSAIINSSYKVDTVNSKDKKKIFIH